MIKNILLQFSIITFFANLVLLNIVNSQNNVLISGGVEYYFFGDQDNSLDPRAGISYNSKLGYKINLGYRQKITNQFKIRGLISYSSSESEIGVFGGGNAGRGSRTGNFKFDKIELSLIPELFFRNSNKFYIGLGVFWNKTVANPNITIKRKGYTMFSGFSMSEEIVKQDEYLNNNDLGLQAVFGVNFPIKNKKSWFSEITYHHGILNLRESEGFRRNLFSRKVGLSTGIIF